MIRPTAVNAMKFGISEVYMKRTPSVLNRLRGVAVRVSIVPLVSSIPSYPTADAVP